MAIDCAPGAANELGVFQTGHIPIWILPAHFAHWIGAYLQDFLYVRLWHGLVTGQRTFDESHCIRVHLTFFLMYSSAASASMKRRLNPVSAFNLRSRSLLSLLIRTSVVCATDGGLVFFIPCIKAGLFTFCQQISLTYFSQGGTLSFVQ